MPATQLYCFAGPMDGKQVLVAGKSISDGNGGKYLKKDYKCGIRAVSVMVHSTVDVSRIDNTVICKVASGGG